MSGNPVRELNESDAVRMIRYCPATDLNFKAALGRLNDAEIFYCIDREKRKGALKSLKAQAKKRGLEGEKSSPVPLEKATERYNPDTGAFEPVYPGDIEKIYGPIRCAAEQSDLEQLNSERSDLEQFTSDSTCADLQVVAMDESDSDEMELTSTLDAEPFEDDLDAEWNARQAERDARRSVSPPGEEDFDEINHSPGVIQFVPKGQIEMYKSRKDYPEISIDGIICQVVNKPGKEGVTIFRIVFEHDTRDPRQIAGDLAVLGQVFCTMRLSGSCVGVKDLEG